MSYGPNNHAGDHTKSSGGNASGGRAGAKKVHGVAINVRSSNTSSTARGTASGLRHYPSESAPTGLGRTMGQGTNVG